MPDSPHTSQVVIGTAGHIDHGKTSLILALTGRDLDRLDEEKRRGITIELGFAFYGDRVAFVDVPGHERLVKTMIAGASAMSAAMLVVAADDGVMPQTREHLAVLRSMGITHGLAVVTKADLVEDDWLELVIEEVREVLGTHGWSDDSPVIGVDSLSGRGIDEVKTYLDHLATTTPDPAASDFFRMPVDRSFVIRGHGRVVTGSVWNGTAQVGDKLRLLPGDEEVRVRGLQARETAVEEVRAGDRAALNLVTNAEPDRGHVLLSPGRGVVTDFLDAAITLIPEARALKQRARVRVHLGTAEVIGRVLLIDRELLQAEETAFVRLALEEPVVALHGDRGVLRFYSPMETLGGLLVLDPSPPSRKRSTPGLLKRLSGFADNPYSKLLESRVVLPLASARAILPWNADRLDETVQAHSDHVQFTSPSRGRCQVHRPAWDLWLEMAVASLRTYHNDHPDELGMPVQALSQQVLGRFDDPGLAALLVSTLATNKQAEEDSGLVRLPSHTPKLAKADAADADRVHSALVEHGMSPPVPSALADELGMDEARVRTLLKALRNVGRAVILEDKVVLADQAWARAVQTVKGVEGPFKLGEVTKLLDTSRKIGVPLLERMDKQGITVRNGDERTVVR